jgi:hypothetical protein
MPINLRYDLRFLPDQTLADRLEDAWQQFARIPSTGITPRLGDPLHANRMKRTFVRHQAMYRRKARMQVALRDAWTVLNASQGSAPGLVIFLPFYLVARLIAQRGVPVLPNAPGESDAFLLKCELEDLQDELQRRIGNRGYRAQRNGRS